MKINKQGLKVFVAMSITVTIATGYILELNMQIRAQKWRSKYMEEKLNSVLEMLTPEQLDKIGDEVDADIEFFKMTKTTLKDTL